VKLVLYDENYTVKQVIEEIEQPVINQNNVKWEDGFLNGINLPFVLLENDIVIGESLTNEVVSLDEKEKYTQVDLEKENQELKARIESAEMAIITLMDFL
jgi:hypothetical protein